MTIGTTQLHIDSFNGADDTPLSGYSYVPSSVSFEIRSNAAALAAGAGGSFKAALINSALLGSANYHVELPISWVLDGGGPGFAGAAMRASGTTALTGYFVSIAGATVFISRVIGGVGTEIFTDYIDELEGAGWKYVRFGVDTNGAGNVVLTVDVAATSGGAYTQVASYIDTAAERILTTGSTGLSVMHPASTTEYVTFDSIRVVGTAAGGGSAPTVTDVDTDESVGGAQTGVVATVTNAGATQSTSALEIVSGATAVAQSITTWSASSIVFGVVLGALRYTASGITHVLRLTTSAGVASLPISVTPAAGLDFVTLAAQNTAPGSITADGNFSGSFTSGMQVEHVTTNGFDILPDGSCSASAPGTYACRANDGSGWQSFTVTLSSGGVDTTAPNIVGSVSVTSITQTTASLLATFDESGNYGIAIIPAAASNPAIANVLAGTVSGALWSRTSTAMTANVAVSAALSALAAGASYKPVLAVEDSEGNSRLIVGSNFTMQAPSGDTTPPTISVSISSAPPAHTLTAVPSDNVGIAGVQWLLNGSPFGAELTAAPWTTNWSEVGQPPGAYIFTARARDAAGNTTLSTSVQVVVASSGGSSPQIASGGQGNYEPRANIWVRVQEGM